MPALAPSGARRGVIIEVVALPVTADLVAYRGDTWAQPFRFTRGGEPVDLTGATVESEARRPNSDERTALEVEVADAGDGRIVLRLPSASLNPALYYYDVEVAENGTVTTWVKGKLNVERDVTNELPAS